MISPASTKHILSNTRKKAGNLRLLFHYEQPRKVSDNSLNYAPANTKLILPKPVSITAV
jgi:hypothetical protein